MVSFRCCSVAVLLLALLLPLILSFAVDGRVHDLIPGWRVPDMPDLSGKVAIVTGPTINGIGLESGVEMARKGAHVILAGRSEGKGKEALANLMERVPGAKADFLKLDLGSLQSVKAFAEAFLAKKLPLHILLNNAGVMASPFSLTVDGFEMQFATNHLGHFLLTKLLLPTLEASAPSRVVTVSSAASFFPEYFHGLESIGLMEAKLAADFDSFGPENNATYSPWQAYGRSKLANILFTRALARRLQGKKVYANVCHPGGIATNLGKHVKEANANMETVEQYFTKHIMLTPPMGAVTQLFLSTSPEVEEKDIRGQYYVPQAKPAGLPKLVTKDLEEKLWAVSEKLAAAYL